MTLALPDLDLEPLRRNKITAALGYYTYYTFPIIYCNCRIFVAVVIEASDSQVKLPRFK